MRRSGMRSNIQKITALALSLAAILLLASCKTEEPQPLPSPTPFVPNIDAFTVGTIDDTGYASTFFGFGFRLPEGWLYYPRSDTDNLNGIKAKETDSDEYRMELIDQLKKGYSLYEYFAGNDQNGESITIYVKDYTNQPDLPPMEVSVLNDCLEWLQDANGDQQDDIKDLRLDVVELLGVEHPIFRYDDIVGGYGCRGALLAIKQGPTFALIKLSGVDDDSINTLLNGYYFVSHDAQVH